MSLAVETDTALADLYNSAAATRERIAQVEASFLRLAGAKFYYRGRRRVTDTTVAEAVEKVEAAAAYIADYKATHGFVEQASYGEYHGTDWSEFACTVATHEADRPAELLAKRAELLAELADVEARMEELEASYTGWSRFFLVTSSQGHIHSSMSCSTCRPTTAYGWLPQLSGSTEAAAVEAHGPALCSVCFSSAPVEWVGGKLTKAQAAKAAH